MRRAPIQVLSGFLSLIILPSVPAQAETVLGRLVELQGTVQVKRKGGKQWQPGDRGMELHPGDLLQRGKNAQAVVVCANGKRWQLSQGTSGVTNECASLQAIETPDGRRLPSRQADELALGDRPYLITPRETTLLTSQPRIQWHRVAGVGAYLVQLHQGDQLFWETQVSDTEITAAEIPKLQPGEEYRLSVITVEQTPYSQHPRPARYARTTIRLLDEAQQFQFRAQLDQVRDRLLSQPGTADIQALLISDLYRQYDLWAEAIARLEAQIQTGSGAIALFNQLGNDYQHIGLDSLAQTRYLQALKLATTPSDGREIAQKGLIELARKHTASRRYADAIVLLDQVGKSESQSVNYDRLVTLAWAQVGQAQADQAKTTLEAALEIDGDRPQAYCVLAVVLKQQQDQGANAVSQKCYDNSSNINSSNANP